MKLSIIIPAYNEQAFIGQCLDAIIKQAKPPYDVEIIVVDNASTDDTAKVAGSYPQVKVISEPAKGTNHARQTGFLASTGDLIANIDGDNLMPAGWIARVFAEFTADSKLVALSGPYLFYDLPRLTRLLADFYYALAFPVYVVNNRFFKKGGAVMAGNLIIRRTALERIGGYNSDLKFYGDDTDTAIRLSKIGLVKFDYSFKMYSSGRRVTKEGAFRTAFNYTINHFWVALFNRPFHSTHQDIRPE